MAKEYKGLGRGLRLGFWEYKEIDVHEI